MGHKEDRTGVKMPTYREDDDRILELMRSGLTLAEMQARGYSRERTKKILRAHGWTYKAGAGWNPPGGSDAKATRG